MAWWSAKTDAELDAEDAARNRKRDEENPPIRHEPRHGRKAEIWQKNPDGTKTKLTAD